jgi:hypothetical protein
VINADITYVDDTLHAGINDYRAVITLADGTLIYSGTASIFYLANNIYVMMPNPLAHGQNLTIISNTTDSGSVVIYDIVGRKVSESVITDSRETVPVQHLAKGVYIVVIYRGGKKSFSGKLLVE